MTHSMHEIFQAGSINLFVFLLACVCLMYVQIKIECFFKGSTFLFHYYFIFSSLARTWIFFFICTISPSRVYLHAKQLKLRWLMYKLAFWIHGYTHEMSHLHQLSRLRINAMTESARNLFSPLLVVCVLLVFLSATAEMKPKIVWCGTVPHCRAVPIEFISMLNFKKNKIDTYHASHHPWLSKFSRRHACR